MSIVVKKFGGSSVGDPTKIRHVARRVADGHQKGEKTVVVVSAMGDTTDHLIDLAKAVAQNRDPREMDMLLTTGEQVSISLLAMALHDLGIPAVSLTGPQAGIQTELHHGKARITAIEPHRIHQELDAGKVVVVAGFQGLAPSGDLATLGRGGSDTSAVALAAALGAPVCEIFTDVNGVYTCDPRLVPSAQKMSEISYEEMMEMASLGAQVLHPRSVECAYEHNVIIHVRSTFLEEDGTFVKGVDAMEIHRAVNGVTLDLNQAKVALLEVPDRPGIAAKLFRAVADAGASVDMIIQSVRGDVTNDIAYTVSRDDLPKAISVSEKVKDDIGAKGVVYDSYVAKVSIVGVGMVGRPGIAAEMFEALSSKGINIQMISTSEIKISCVVAADQAQEAVKIIHDQFAIGQEAGVQA